MAAVFWVSFKNKFSRNTDTETGSFLSAAYASSSYNPLFVTPHLVATGEYPNVMNRRLGLGVTARSRWKPEGLIKRVRETSSLPSSQMVCHSEC